MVEDAAHMLTAALQSADENDTHKKAVQQWIEDVCDTLLNAQDILDECSLHEVIIHDGGDTLCYCCNSPKLIIFLYKKGPKKREIKGPMEFIMETTNELKLMGAMGSFETGTYARTVQPGVKWKKSSMMKYGFLPLAADIKVQNIAIMFKFLP